MCAFSAETVCKMSKTTSKNKFQRIGCRSSVTFATLRWTLRISEHQHDCRKLQVVVNRDDDRLDWKKKKKKNDRASTTNVSEFILVVESSLVNDGER